MVYKNASKTSFPVKSEKNHLHLRAKSPLLKLLQIILVTIQNFCFDEISKLRPLEQKTPFLEKDAK